MVVGAWPAQSRLLEQATRGTHFFPLHCASLPHWVLKRHSTQVPASSSQTGVDPEQSSAVLQVPPEPLGAFERSSWSSPPHAVATRSTSKGSRAMEERDVRMVFPQL